MADDHNPAPPGCPMAAIKPFFESGVDPTRRWPVVRITPKWYIVRFNYLAVGKYRRKDGWPQSAFHRGNMTPDRMVNLDELEAFAAARGGTWDSGWKPEKQKETP